MQEELKALLQETGADRFFRLQYEECVDSTNEVIKRAAAKGEPEGFLSVAEEQTAGKGRSGRTWISPKAGAVYFSFLLRPEQPPQNAASLTLAAGLSVAQAVREQTGLDAMIKWPNDIVIGHRKICGILTEAGAHAGKIDYLAVGIGINVNNEAFDPSIAEKATSLFIENKGTEVSAAAVVAGSLVHFQKNYEIFRQSGDLSGLMEAYNALLVSRDREVRIEDPAGAYEAVSRRIDANGRLLVERRDGTKSWIDAGEVSVRGLLGYI
ncbi:MAG: biotin--[acetyl-CoA-carboxylase] ligase [Lachnospiraceae bacterium]|nr:biotin--[acetyl-CoA-carboxylase] ligase [Lachnospiraceae bacterium]